MTERLEPVFVALADGTRRAVLRSLAEGGPASATALAGRFPVTRQAIAKHLQVLQEAGLVAAERHGRETRWTVTPAPLEDAMAWMADVGSQWDDRLAALRRHLERTAPHRGERPFGFRPPSAAGEPGADRPGMQAAARRRPPDPAR